MGTTNSSIQRSARFTTCAAALGCALGGAPCVRAQVIADSVAQFSGTQGMHGWEYGYFEGPSTPAAFQRLPNYGVSDTLWPGNLIWYRHGTSHWTLLGASMTHPNGLRACGTRTSVINWTVRRWVSTVAGPVRVNINVADAFGVCGNGIGVQVFHNDTSVYSAGVGPGSSVVPDIPLCLNVGDRLDFTTDPGGGGNECCDDFTFAIQIHVAVDPNCTPCRADFDQDGFLTGLDFDAYLTAFESGNLSADFDADGFITGLDFDAYVRAFEAGC